jgi:hypothetical protein
MVSFTPELLNIQQIKRRIQPMFALILETLQAVETMNRPQQSLGYVNIGRYQSWLENGELKLYSHQFGKACGVSCAFSPDEIKGLLEMLTSQKQGYVNIGRYQSWQEDGELKLYSHPFGKTCGMSCAFSPQETKGLLEMLTSHSDNTENAMYKS